MVDKLPIPCSQLPRCPGTWASPRTTLQSWLKDDAPGGPLVHVVPARKRGYPTMPFVAVIEAYVLRSLRDLGLSKGMIRQAALEVRDAFGTRYALASKPIVTDGVDLFSATPRTSTRGWETAGSDPGSA